MQLTFPTPTQDEAWNWQTNVADGQTHLAANMSSGYSWLQSQLAAWAAWNAGNPSPVAPAQDYWEGSCCVFSAKGTGTFKYDVAIGLKMYASGVIGGRFIEFHSNGSTANWQFNPGNGVRPDIVYEFSSCSSLQTCQHSGAGYPQN